MPKKPSSLERVRRQIDQIDNDLHDLLMKRARLVDRISAAKARGGGGPVMRPEREAQVLRRLLGRNKGKLPPDVVARIWRELFPAMVRLQGPLQVIVCPGSKPIAVWDLARSQFGSATPMSVVKSPTQALRRVTLDRGRRGSIVAVVPAPGPRGVGLWWQRLAMDNDGKAKVFAKLPFVDTAADGEAMVVGSLDWQPSGDDCSLIAVTASARATRPQILNWMMSAGLTASFVTSAPKAGSGRRRLHLLQVSEYVSPSDPRLDDAVTGPQQGLIKAVVIGGYPACFNLKPRR